MPYQQEKPRSPEHKEKLRVAALRREEIKRQVEQRHSQEQLSALSVAGPATPLSQATPDLEQVWQFAGHAANDLESVAAALGVTPTAIEASIRKAFNLDWTAYQTLAIKAAQARINRALMKKAQAGDTGAREVLAATLAGSDLSLTAEEIKQVLAYRRFKALSAAEQRKELELLFTAVQAPPAWRARWAWSEQDQVFRPKQELPEQRLVPEPATGPVGFHQPLEPELIELKPVVVPLPTRVNTPAVNEIELSPGLPEPVSKPAPTVDITAPDQQSRQATQQLAPTLAKEPDQTPKGPAVYRAPTPFASRDGAGAEADAGHNMAALIHDYNY